MIKIQETMQNEHIKKFINKYYVIVLSIAVILFGAFYNYGLRMAFIPDSEDLLTISSCYKTIHLGAAYAENHDLLYKCIAFLSTLLGGMSFFSMRLCFTLLHTILLSCTLYLTFRARDTKPANLYLIPLFALIAILLHPVTPEDPYGMVTDCGTDFIYQYPYDYHYTARIYTLICFIIISLFFSVNSFRKKLLCCIAAGIMILYSLSLKDTMFYFLFLLPFCIAVFLRTLHNDKTKKYALTFVCIVLGLITLTRFLPSSGKIRSILWTKEAASTYGSIYGGTNWLSVDMIWTAIENYIIKVLDLFNILLPSSPVISLYTVVYILKLLLLIIGYVIVFKIVRGTVAGTNRQEEVDLIDEALAWSYVILSAAHLFTEYGHNNMYSRRYASALVTIMAILLCRYLPIILQSMRWIPNKILTVDKTKLFLITSALCLCTIKPVWTYTPAKHCHEDDMNAILEHIRSTDLGYAISSFYLSEVMDAMSNGEILIYCSPEEVKTLYGKDAKISYLITRYDYEPGKYHSYMYYENFENYEQLCDKFSKPSYIIDYDTLSLCVWENGMVIQE